MSASSAASDQKSLQEQAEATAAAIHPRTGENLLDSEHTYRALIEALPQIIFLKDKDSVYVSCNRNYAKLVGIDAKEIEGKTDFEFFPKDLADKYRADDKRIMESGKTEEIEEEYVVTGTGERQMIQTVKTPFRDAHGRIVGVLGIFRDITERKQAEEKLKEQAALLNLASDAIIVCGLDSKIRFWNRGAKDLYGWSAEEAIGKVSHDLLQTEFPVPLEQILAAIQQSDEWDGELRHIGRNGQVIVAASRWSLQRNDRGAPSAILEITRDITAQKQAEELIRLQAQQHETLVSMTRDGYLRLDREARLLDVNDTFCRMFGYSRDELLQLHVNDLDAGLRPEQVRQRMQSAMETGFDRCESKGRRKNGELFDIEVSVSYWKAAGQFLAFLRDITDRKRAEETLLRMNRVLKTIRACNEVIVRAPDEMSLLKQICEVAVQTGGYLMTWVGYADHDENKTVRPVAETGFEDGYLRTANITWADLERGRGPTGTAIRTGEIDICQDFLADPRTGPWREEALKRGYRASIALPLKNEAGVFGAFTLYAAEAGAFDAEEKQFLAQLAIDLSYGVMALRNEAERKRAEETIRLQAIQHETLVSTVLDTYLRLDPAGKLLEVNDAFCRVFGYTRDEALQLNLRVIDASEDPEFWARQLRQIVAAGFGRFETLSRRKNGEIFNIEVSCSFSTTLDQFLGFGRDITERKRTEEALRRSESVLAQAGQLAHLGAWDMEVSNPENLLSNKVSWSEETYRILGYEPDSVEPGTGRFFQHVHPEDQQKLKEALETSVESKQPYHREFRIVRDGGEQRTVTGRGEVSFDALGRPIRILGTIQDITERKRTEEELARSEKRFKLLADSNIIAVMVADRSGRIRDYNQAYLDITGYTREDFDSGRIGWRHMVAPEDHDAAVNQSGRELLERGVYGPREAENIRKDGTRVPILMGLVALDSPPDKVIGFMIDLTKLKKAEEALRRSQAVLTHAEQMARLGAWELDFSGATPEGLRRSDAILAQAEQVARLGTTAISNWDELNRTPLHWSDETYRIFGYEPGSIQASTELFFHHIHPDDRERVIQSVTESITLRKPYQIEAKIVRPDGSVRAILGQAETVFNAHGQPQRIVGAIQDITERKRAEEALRESKNILALKHQVAQVLLTASDEDMYGEVLKVIMQATDSKEGVFGYIDEDGSAVFPSMTAIWQKCKLTDQPMRFPRETWKGFWGRAMIEKKTIYSNQPANVPEGHPEIYRALAVPILNRDELDGLLMVANRERDYGEPDIERINLIVAELAPVLRARLQRDRHEKQRKLAEEALTLRSKELARSNEDLQQFAYAASHDLQEPLRMVASYTQLLAKRYQGKLDADADEFIGFAVDGARRMQALVNDLLDFSRVGTRGKKFVDTSCEQVLGIVLNNLKVAIEERHAIVTHDPLPTIKADATQLSQVFQNLIGNALKFHKPEEPPQVHVSAQQEGEAWHFSVRDSGIGIAPQDMGRLFVIFQRLHTRAEYPGTGMGLAIAKKIVERHGGKIWVESEPGQGATFHFTIPDGKR
ncbi:MAG: PAS domain S-box protein [Acidobacteriia bacterium]|nr:PAS domain S-box protein [Terriglobia bacterium]